MFLDIGNGEMINTDNVDKVYGNWDDEPKEGIIIFSKCVVATVPTQATIGSIKFKDKDSYNEYIDKLKSSLLHDDIKESLKGISGALINIGCILSDINSK